jgi:hypothetical protein
MKLQFEELNSTVRFRLLNGFQKYDAVLEKDELAGTQGRFILIDLIGE